MSKISVDIDALLGEDILTITLGGKEYEIKDVQTDIFLRTAKINEEDAKGTEAHEQLATILGVDPEEIIKTVGFRAAGMALKHIMDWIMLAVPEDAKGMKKGGAGSGNP